MRKDREKAELNKEEFNKYSNGNLIEEDGFVKIGKYNLK